MIFHAAPESLCPESHRHPLDYGYYCCSSMWKSSNPNRIIQFDDRVSECSDLVPCQTLGVEKACDYNVRCYNTIDGCCTQDMPCLENDGDCDGDIQCASGYVCGDGNCILLPGLAIIDHTKDCCTKHP